MLGPDDVEAWFARPDALAAGDRRDAAAALVTSEERAAIERFRFERDRELHLAARALLRRTLSRHADVDPRAWRFTTNAHGRPEILTPAASLRFNVSHTAGLVMVAVALARDVGADVERVPDAVPWDVVESSFADGERALVRDAPDGEQPARFAELWTLKEAYLKARGHGLSLPLAAFAFGLAPARLVEGDDAAAWHLETVSPTRAHRAALCVRAEARPTRIGVRWDDLASAV